MPERVPSASVTARQQRNFVPCGSNFLARFCVGLSAKGSLLRLATQGSGSGLAEK
jgi:hypothetical protein